jgi:hypothetical protein
MLRMLIGRCHVGDSNSEVIRYVISRMEHGNLTYRAQYRQERHELLRSIIKIHAENRALYTSVMSGSFGYTG